MSTEIDDILARQPTTEFAPSLTEADVTAFRERGFISLPRITTDEEVIWLREVYDWLFADKSRVLEGLHFDLTRPDGSEGEDRLPQIIAPEHRLPALKTTAFWRNGRFVASRLMSVDEDVLQAWGHMIRKPPLIGEPLPWHQDEAYWDPKLVYRALGSWLPLDEATPENGCMSFIPGSHVNEILPHRHVNDDPVVQALWTTPDPADIARAVQVPVPAGGAVFHHSRTLHSSGPNTTDRARRAWATEWQLAPAKADIARPAPWLDEQKAARAEREKLQKAT